MKSILLAGMSSVVFLLPAEGAAEDDADAAAAGDQAAERPSAESIHELLKLTKVRDLLGQMTEQIFAQMEMMSQVELNGYEPTPSQQKLLLQLKTRVQDVVLEDLDWARLEPLYTEIYQSVFTPEEVEGMLAFYRTPVGQATVSKTPLVMQMSMQRMQERMGPMMEKLQKIQDDFVAAVKLDALRQQMTGDEQSDAAADASATAVPE